MSPRLAEAFNPRILHSYFVLSNFRVFVMSFHIQFAENEITKRITKTRKYESMKKCSQLCECLQAPHCPDRSMTTNKEPARIAPSGPVLDASASVSVSIYCLNSYAHDAQSLSGTDVADISICERASRV